MHVNTRIAFVGAVLKSKLLSLLKGRRISGVPHKWGRRPAPPSARAVPLIGMMVEQESWEAWRDEIIIL